MSAAIRVLLVDDQPLIREGMRLIFELQEGIEVVGEASDGEAALEFLAKAAVDVVLMDVVEMFRPVTKWASTVYNANTIPEIIRKAVRLARTEKPGAVHIELCEDIAKRETEKAPLPEAATSTTSTRYSPGEVAGGTSITQRYSVAPSAIGSRLSNDRCAGQCGA